MTGPVDYTVQRGVGQVVAVYEDGRTVPLPLSVTKVLREGGLVDESVAAYYTPESRQRGLELADALVDYAAGAIPSVSAAVLPYWQQVRAFLAEGRFEIDRVEQWIGDPALGYNGRYDLSGRLLDYGVSEILDLIDVKSGTIPRTVGAQTIGYRRRMPEPRVRRWVLQVTPDGYKLVPLNVDARTGRIDRVRDVRDEKLFLAALTVAQFRRGLYV